MVAKKPAAGAARTIPAASAATAPAALMPGASTMGPAIALRPAPAITGWARVRAAVSAAGPSIRTVRVTFLPPAIIKMAAAVTAAVSRPDNHIVPIPPITAIIRVSAIIPVGRIAIPSICRVAAIGPVPRRIRITPRQRRGDEKTHHNPGRQGKV